MNTWLITGASTGLGRQLAESVLEHGDRAVVTARKPDSLGALVARYPDRAAAVELDITKAAQIDVAPAQARERFGGIDILVNNAGYGLLAALEETDDTRLARVLETNLTGPLRLVRAVIPVFREQGHGHITPFPRSLRFRTSWDSAFMVPRRRRWKRRRMHWPANSPPLASR